MTMASRLLSPIALVAALGATAAPAAAQPAIDAPSQPCYVAAQPTETQPVAITAHGFAPYAVIDVYVDDMLQAEPQADGAGNVSGSVPAPFVASGERPFTLRLTAHEDPAETATATSRVTALSVRQIPAQARTRARVRFRGRGFIQPGPVYAHYIFGGRSYRTVRVALPHGACGVFARRMRQFPFRHSPKVGDWTIQFDQQPDYGAPVDVSARLTVTVNRAPRS